MMKRLLPYRPLNKARLTRLYSDVQTSLLAFCGFTIIFIAIHSHLMGVTTSKELVPRATGNLDFAQDIYGLGIRTGLYLQAIAAIVVALRPLRQPGGATPIIFSTVICISILGSWTRRAALSNISPAETIVIFNMLATNLATALIGTLNSGFRGNAFGIWWWLISSLWLHAAQLWFYSVGRLRLPLLGTEDMAWFFVPVEINGWYWKVMVALSSMGALSGLLASRTMLKSIIIPTATWWWKRKQDDHSWVSFEVFQVLAIR
jgi:hypothetical protein